jgi:hypothetical protein
MVEHWMSGDAFSRFDVIAIPQPFATRDRKPTANPRKR